MNDTQLLAIIGLCTGILLGLSARIGGFTTFGAIHEAMNGRYARALMWPVAMGWAMLFISIAIWLDYFVLEAVSQYKYSPNYVAHIIGGLAFGYGMVLAGMCSFEGLARIGSGDSGALIVVLIIGITAYMTDIGPLAFLRELYFEHLPIEKGDSVASLAQFIFEGTNVPVGGVIALFGMAFIVLPMLHFSFRRSFSPFWAMLTGFAISSAWIGTMSIALISYEFIAVQSHSFSFQIGSTMIYMMTSANNFVQFGIGSVFGVILGGFLGSLIKRGFRWDSGGNKRKLPHLILGASLMGFGSAIALGCSIGQGISMMAVLSFGAPLTISAIIAGAYFGHKYSIRG